MGYDDPYMDEDGEPLMDPEASSDLPVDDDDEDEGDWGWRDRSPTPVMNPTDDYRSGKPKKRLVKRGREISPDRSGSPAPPFDEEWLDDYEDEDSSSKKKMKSTPSLKEGKGGSLKKKKKTIAGGDSEDDQEGIKNVNDDNFIDDCGVDPADRYGSDNEHFAGDLPTLPPPPEQIWCK